MSDTPEIPPAPPVDKEWARWRRKKDHQLAVKKAARRQAAEGYRLILQRLRSPDPGDEIYEMLADIDRPMATRALQRARKQFLCLVHWCAWCRKPCSEQAITKDHLIPQWARRALAEMDIEYDDRIVLSCVKCNQDKGPMPPAVYAVVRNDVRRPALFRFWSEVSARYGAKIMRRNDYEVIKHDMLIKVPEELLFVIPKQKEAPAGETPGPVGHDETTVE